MRNQLRTALWLRCLLSIIAFLLWSPGVTAAVLAENGESAYRIVVPADADESTQAVAEDFAALFRQVSSAALEVVSDETPARDTEIVVGHNNARLPELGLAAMTNGFAQGEYAIRTVGDKLVIAGRPPRGTINGMYGFLQDYLGCRWFTPGVSRIPRRATVELTQVHDRQKPAFRYRSTVAAVHWDAAWTARNRLNECKAYGGSISTMSLMSDARVKTIGNYYSAHGFSYVNSVLFDSHPAYFGLKDGERCCAPEPHKRVFCLSSDGLGAYMARQLKNSLRGMRPPHCFVGLGHADNTDTCECDLCKAAIDRNGVTGMYMQFHNRVAEKVASEFPNAIISVLCYGITFDPTPVHMHRNVRVTWAPIVMCHAHAFDECDGNRNNRLLPKLAAWQERGSQVQVWYYQHMVDSMLPYISLFPTKRDLRAFRRMGVQDVMVEGSPDPTRRDNPVADGDRLLPAYGEAERCGYFTIPFGLEHLKAYIVSRLLWDPDYDVAAGIREFCHTYYGAAGAELTRYALAVESIGAYAKTVGPAFQNIEGVHQSGSFAPLLRWGVVRQMDEVFDRAEAKVADDDALLRRVHMARLSLQEEILCFAPVDSPLRPKAFNGFFSLVEELGLQKLYRTAATGKRLTVEQFKQVMMAPEKLPAPGELAPES